MQHLTLYESKNHILLCLYDNNSNLRVPGAWVNQYLIKRNNKTILLNPVSINNMARVLVGINQYTNLDQVSDIILSHQDPEIFRVMVPWLMLTKATVHVSNVWVKSLSDLEITTQIDRIHGIPDNGMNFPIDDYYGLELIPAYFLNSEGDINVYDPESKILFSGCIGSTTANMAGDLFVENFNHHMQYIKPWHQRYMSSNRAIKAWLKRIEKLDIKMIVPQHGKIYKGKVLEKLLIFLDDLPCGIDLFDQDGLFNSKG